MYDHPARLVGIVLGHLLSRHLGAMPLPLFVVHGDGGECRSGACSISSSGGPKRGAQQKKETKKERMTSPQNRKSNASPTPTCNPNKSYTLSTLVWNLSIAPMIGFSMHVSGWKQHREHRSAISGYSMTPRPCPRPRLVRDVMCRGRLSCSSRDARASKGSALGIGVMRSWLNTLSIGFA